MVSHPITGHAVHRGVLIANPISSSARLHPLYVVGAMLCDEAGNVHHFEYRFDRETFLEAIRSTTRDALRIDNVLTLAAASYLSECIRATAFYHGWI